jgi:hypothetical protein
MRIARNCTQRRDQSGSKRGKGGKHLQQQHDQQLEDHYSGDQSKITTVGLTTKICDGFD